jgi:hypothetical protein
VSHVLISGIPNNTRVTQLPSPRQEGSEIIAAEQIWPNEHVEKSLAKGTAFVVPAHYAM